MSSKKMMLVSLLATICLSILSIVGIMLFSIYQDDGVKKAAENLSTKKEQPVEIESPETEVAAFFSKGLRYYTDEFGTHDVYFEEETVERDYVGTTGPIDIHVTNIQMARFYPNAGIGSVFTEGHKEMTLVAVTLDVANTTGSKAYFELTTVRGKVDSGEVSPVEAVLSDDFKFTYEPNEKRSGTIYFMYKSSPDKLATLTMSFSSAEDASFTAIDKGTKIKVDLY